MSKPKRKKKTTIGDILWRIIFFAALVVFCYCAFRLVTIFLEYKRGTDEYSALEQRYVIKEETDKEKESEQENRQESGNTTKESDTQGMGTDEEPATEPETETEIVEDEQGRTTVKIYPVMKNPIDFKSLKEVNEDIIGWIKVNALDISYPIAQGEDNEYYLHKTFERQDNFAGCIFMEYQNKSDFSDKNTIIYGHNMKNGSMFGTLKKFYEEGVYESAPYFWIYTPDKIYKYDIFSCSQVDASGRAYQITFSDEEDFSRYLDEAKVRSVVDSGKVQVDTTDKIVTLSTCTGNEATRFIVQGKLAKTYKALNP